MYVDYAYNKNLNGEKSKILNIVLVVANSHSMVGPKIDTLNQSIEELIPELIEICQNDVLVAISIMSVAQTAKWEVYEKRVDEKYRFDHMQLSDSNEINVQSAIELLEKDFFCTLDNRENIFCPIVFWFIDNKVTPKYEESLNQIKMNRLLKKPYVME